MPSNPVISPEDIAHYRAKALDYRQQCHTAQVACTLRGFARFMGHHPVYFSSNKSPKAKALRMVVSEVWGEPLPEFKLTLQEELRYRVAALAYATGCSSQGRVLSYRGFARFLGHWEDYFGGGSGARADAIREIAKEVWFREGFRLKGGGLLPNQITPENYLSAKQKGYLLADSGRHQTHEYLTQNYGRHTAERYLVVEYRRVSKFAQPV
jgi:hypothetical protein